MDTFLIPGTQEEPSKRRQLPCSQDQTSVSQHTSKAFCRLFSGLYYQLLVQVLSFSASWICVCVSPCAVFLFLSLSLTQEHKVSINQTLPPAFETHWGAWFTFYSIFVVGPCFGCYYSCFSHFFTIASLQLS